MTKHLPIRDEDYERAHNLAERLGTSIDETLSRALQAFEVQNKPNGPLSASQQADLAAIRALVDEAQKHIVPHAAIDEGWLYDWNGLPA